MARLPGGCKVDRRRSRLPPPPRLAAARRRQGEGEGGRARAKSSHRRALCLLGRWFATVAGIRLGRGRPDARSIGRSVGEEVGWRTAGGWLEDEQEDDREKFGEDAGRRWRGRSVVIERRRQVGKVGGEWLEVCGCS